MNSKKRRRFREQLKEDLEEAMAKVGEHSKQAENENQDDAEAPKKKRRRQKKGKKKSEEDGDTDDKKPAAAVVSDQPNEDDAKSKRKRKKKGRKAQKQDDDMNATEANPVGTVELKQKRRVLSIPRRQKRRNTRKRKRAR